MTNILDYIQWRGDLTFSKDPFNKIDALIFSRFSYIQFKELFLDTTVVTIQEVAEHILNIDYKYIIEEDAELLKALKDAKRFKDLRITLYEDHFEEASVKQFAAMTIEIDPKHIYVAYRGTDNTLLGWKEDFLMTYKSHISSQKEAVNYLEEVIKETDASIYIGGHSKGGNLAHYAYIYLNPKRQDRVLAVYSFDGPGFQSDILKTNEYAQALDKLITYLPQSSIIGKMLDNNNKYEIIHSFKNGYSQHDIYTWKVIANDFIYEEKDTFTSRVLDSTFEDYLNQLSVTQREKIVSLIFDIAESTGVKTLREMKEKPISSIKKMIETTSSLDKESGQLLLDTFKVLASSIGENTKEELTKLNNNKEENT